MTYQPLEKTLRTCPETLLLDSLNSLITRKRQMT
jgi:hypothetical protein